MARTYSKSNDDMTPRRALMLIAYPRLREFPPGQRDAVLERARNAPFDAIEWAGMAASVALTTLALDPIGGDFNSAMGRYLGQFLLALPLLAALVGPFLLRRTRRALDLELAKRNGGESWTHDCERQDDALRPQSSARPE